MTAASWASPDPVGLILDNLMAGLTTALEGTEAGLPPRMETAHGTMVTYDSAPMGWVRSVQIYPSQQSFGQPDSQFVPRKQPFRWAVDVELGVIRCVASIQSKGNQPVLPSADQVAADTATILADARALRAAVQYLTSFRGDALIRNWQPIGPSGGYGGGAIQVAVPFQDCKPTVT